MRVFAVSVLLLALLAFHAILAQESAAGGSSPEDQLEEEGNVESEGAERAEKVPTGSAADSGAGEPGMASDTPSAEQQDEMTKLQLGPSDKVQLSHLFLYPAGAGQVGRSLDLPTGKTIRVAMHMRNKGDSTFHVDLATAAFRYPMDMSYVIQNFSTVRYHGQDVEPGREASFVYQFNTDPQLAARSFGLTVQLGYRDAEGKNYLHSAINQTVSLFEPDEGFDGETFFMYIFLIVLAALACAGIWYLLKTYTPAKKLAAKSRHAVKSSKAAALSADSADGSAPNNNNGGLSPGGNYNLEWIPQQHLDIKNRRAKTAQSPRQRKLLTGPRLNGLRALPSAVLKRSHTRQCLDLSGRTALQVWHSLSNGLSIPDRPISATVEPASRISRLYSAVSLAT
uniref:Translocon-associated protein subunit alpha n=1 Tax=Macrostomum lignano TaxID=282301 RepID=A0A1I8IQY8_9PLAT